MNFYSVFFAVIFLAVSGAACAHGVEGSRPAANPHPEAGAKRGVLTNSLDDVTQGLLDFERRASNYRPEEWDFVLGYAHYRSGKWDEADHFFRKVASSMPLVGDYILYYRAVIANRLDRHAEAMQFLDVLQEGHPESVWSGRAVIERAVALIGIRNSEEGRALLASAKKGATETDLGEIERLIAASLIADGLRDSAIAEVKRMAEGAVNEAELAGLKTLFDAVQKRFHYSIEHSLENPHAQYRLAQSFADHSQWDDASNQLLRLLERDDLDDETRIRAKWLLARSLRWIHRYDEAIALMEDLRKDPRARGLIEGILSTLATTYAKKSDYGKAIAIRRSLMDGVHPNSRAAASLAYKIAFLYMDEDRYKEAIPLWRQMTGMRGADQLAAGWYLAWCHYKLGDITSALEGLDELLTKGARKARIEDRVLYWKSQMLAAVGRKAEARETYGEVISKYPNGYYAELAVRRRGGYAYDTANFGLVHNPAKGEYRLWTPGPTGEGGNSIHLSRAVLFDRLGLHEEAGRELRAVDLKRDLKIANTVMWLASKNFAHDVAFRIAGYLYRDTLHVLPEGGGFPVFVWQQSYPRAFRPLVEKLAAENGVDPFLVWSIMRNESSFRPDALSPAGAVGLMQLMPATANKLAAESGLPPVQRDELYRPARNIAFGVAYLGKLLSLFPGNVVAVIASYNAGEEAADRWLKNGQMEDIEEWIEEIPYVETNLYVKKVLTSYWNFQRLYSSR